MANYITDVLSWFVSVVTLILAFAGFCTNPVWGVLLGGAAVISNPIFHKIRQNKKPLLKLLGLVPAGVLTALFLAASPTQPATDSTLAVNDTVTADRFAAAGDAATTESLAAAESLIAADNSTSTADGGAVSAAGYDNTGSSGQGTPEQYDTDVIYDSSAADAAASPVSASSDMTNGANSAADAANSAVISADMTDDTNVAADMMNSAGASASDSDSLAELQVHFIDVGQGDATLLTCGGHAMLIDAGDNNKGTTVQLYLAKQGVDHLDYLVLTHSDADHIGGADVVISKFNIDNIFFSNYEQDTKAYRELMDTLQARGRTYTTPAAGETYALGDASFTILGPLKSYGDANNSSISLMVEHGEKRFLFTGDCEETAEADLTASGRSLSADVYQAGHHGSRSSSSQKLMDAVSPAYAVISCGEDNSYGHPHAEVLNRFRSMGIKVFRTDEQGSVVAVSDGASVTWNCAPSETWQAGEPKGSSASSAGQNNSSGQGGSAAAGADTGSQSTNTAPAGDAGGSGRYIGNVNNGKLHLSSCGHLPNPENRAYFDTREAAVAAGYDDPCKFCKP